MTPSGESVIHPNWGPWPVSDLFPDLTTGDCAALADMLECDAIRGEQIAANLPALWKAKRGVAQLLRALANGDVTLVDKGNTE